MESETLFNSMVTTAKYLLINFIILQNITQQIQDKNFILIPFSFPNIPKLNSSSIHNQPMTRPIHFNFHQSLLLRFAEIDDFDKLTCCLDQVADWLCRKSATPGYDLV